MKKLLLLVVLVHAACAGKTAPVVVSQATLGLTQSLGQMQTLVQELNTGGIINHRTALNAQEQLAKINKHVSHAVPLLKEMDAAQLRGEKVSIQNVELVLSILTAISKELTLVMSGVPADEAMQLVTIVQQTQELVSSTLVEVARLKAALAG